VSLVIICPVMDQDILWWSWVGNTATVHMRDAGSNTTWSKKISFNNFLTCISYIAKVTDTKLWNMNWLMGYRDTVLTDILRIPG